MKFLSNSRLSVKLNSKSKRDKGLSMIKKLNIVLLLSVSKLSRKIESTSSNLNKSLLAERQPKKRRPDAKSKPRRSMLKLCLMP